MTFRLGTDGGTNRQTYGHVITKFLGWIDSVEIGYLTTFGALKMNRYQVMTLETWLKIYTNVCNFVTVSPQTI